MPLRRLCNLWLRWAQELPTIRMKSEGRLREVGSAASLSRRQKANRPDSHRAGVVFDAIDQILRYFYSGADRSRHISGFRQSDYEMIEIELMAGAHCLRGHVAPIVHVD